MVSPRTIQRLSVYGRVLRELARDGVEAVFSHELARRSGATAAQVRRDLMVIGYSGSPQHGYVVVELLESVERFLDPSGGQTVALVGVGNLGTALLAYFRGRRPKLRIAAAFDRDPRLTGRVLQGCRVYGMDELSKVALAEGIDVGIVAVPADQAQEVADALVRAGVRGLLNFAPVSLRVADGVHVEDIDMATALEKAAYFARQGAMNEDAVT